VQRQGEERESQVREGEKEMTEDKCKHEWQWMSDGWYCKHGCGVSSKGLQPDILDILKEKIDGVLNEHIDLEKIQDEVDRIFMEVMK